MTKDQTQRTSEKEKHMNHNHGPPCNLSHTLLQHYTCTESLQYTQLQSLSVPCMWLVMHLESSTAMILTFGKVKNISETQMKAKNPPQENAWT